MQVRFAAREHHSSAQNKVILQHSAQSVGKQRHKESVERCARLTVRTKKEHLRKARFHAIQSAQGKQMQGRHRCATASLKETRGRDASDYQRVVRLKTWQSAHCAIDARKHRALPMRFVTQSAPHKTRFGQSHTWAEST